MINEHLGQDGVSRMKFSFRSRVFHLSDKKTNGEISNKTKKMVYDALGHTLGYVYVLFELIFPKKILFTRWWNGSFVI